jgi:hypothetical protein
MKTGTEAAEPGLYASECCLQEQSFVRGQTLTRCPKCGRLTTWETVETDKPKAA